MKAVKNKPYSRPPTLKQIKALQYINQGHSQRQAMLKAGYSINSAMHPTKNLMKRPGVQRMITTMAAELSEEGITTRMMVQKFKEWLSAEKFTNSFTEPDKKVPDYKTQLEAYKEWKKIMDQHEQQANPDGSQIKRRLTIDEFVTGEEVIDGES